MQYAGRASSLESRKKQSEGGIQEYISDRLRRMVWNVWNWVTTSVIQDAKVARYMAMVT